MALPSTTYFGLTGDSFVDGVTSGYKWALDSTRTVDFSISNGFSGEYWYAPATVAEYMQTALSLYSYYANIKFNYVGYFSTPSIAASNGSEINLSLDGVNRFFTSSNVWAIGLFPSSSYNTTYYNGAPGDLYININSQANSLPTYAPGSQGWFLLMHELGHVLGLKHPHDSGGTGRPTFTSLGIGNLDIDVATVMSYNDGSSWNLYSWDPATPMVLDVLGLMYLYGKNTATNSGNTTFTLKEYNYYITLWDASGTDTLDASQASSGWTIFMPNVVFSDLVSEKVGAAAPTSDFNSTTPHTLEWLIGDIENVIGTNYSDVITGNSLDNLMSGGAGNDTINGGAGNDTINGGAGNDVIYGGSGNDIFDWDATQRGGADTFYGGSGDDIYVLTAGDIVVENANEGTDVIYVDFSYSLVNAPNVEVLIGYGTQGLSLVGSSNDDLIRGTSGNDTINGGGGSDIARYQGNFSQYQIISMGGDAFQITDSVAGRDGFDSMTNIENILFADQSLNITSMMHPTASIFLNRSQNVDFLNAQLLDTAVNIAANLDTLEVNRTKISSITVSDHKALLVTSVQSSYDADILRLITLGGGSYTIRSSLTKGGAANDFLIGTSSNDSIDGGSGLDISIYTGTYASHNISNQTNGTFVVTDNVAGRDGVDTLTNVERLQFSDYGVALDLDAPNSAGGIYRLYQAAFDRKPDLSGLGYWIDAADNGKSAVTMAEDFTWSQEFLNLFHLSTPKDNYFTGVSVQTLVEGIYQHVLHRTADSGGLSYYTGVIQSHEKTVGRVLAEISDSSENHLAVASSIANGIQYTPWASSMQTMAYVDLTDVQLIGQTTDLTPAYF